MPLLPAPTPQIIPSHSSPTGSSGGSSVLTRIFLPFSWILTFAGFGIGLIRFFVTIPVRIFYFIYERKLRARFPKLPSVQRLLFQFSQIIDTLARDLVPHVPPHPNDDPNNLPPLPVDLDEIKRGKT